MVLGDGERLCPFNRFWPESLSLSEASSRIGARQGDGGKACVKVHQLVKSLQGDVLSDSEVLHVFTVNDGLIAAMDLGGEADPAAGPSAAFPHRS